MKLLWFRQGTIKDIHATVINNDLEGLKKKLDEPPISPIVLCGKDGNGLNSLHKVSSLDESAMNFFNY